MNNKKRLTLSVVLFLLPHLFSAQKVREQDLQEKHKEWLKLVEYIIQPAEKNVFLKLGSERDRDIFIETFWKQRDPTPGTPVNEYKDEHVRRFHHANKFYGRGTSREGWRTDMGRIYIILGQPTSVERFEVSSYLVPCQAWSYYGDVSKDLPSHFVLIFFQRGGAGEYKLYDPVGDGPAALLMNKRDIDPMDYAEIYDLIKEIAPTLADISISLVPGEYNYDYSPSVRNTIILANILNSPKKNISVSYATHFLNYRGMVSTEYLTNYVEADTDVSVIEDPLLGVPFVHFALVPKNLSVDYYEPKDQYYCNMRLDVSLRVGEDIFFQYAKDFPLYFSEKELAVVKANGISIEDSFPAVEGRYRLIALLQNSVGKEFSILEKDLVIPAGEKRPGISGPFLGYKFEAFGPQVHLPYKVLDEKLLLDPKNTFATQDTLAFFFNILNCPREVWASGAARVHIKGLRPDSPMEKSFSLSLRNFPFQKIMSLRHSFPLNDLAPDYYEVRVALTEESGRVLEEAKANFILSAKHEMAHPIAKAKTFPLSNRHVFFHMLARQHDKRNENEMAEAQYRKVFESAPDFREGLLDYSWFLLKVKKYDRALEVIEGLKEDKKSLFDYFLVRGQAQMGLESFGDALASFLEGNKIYNSDIRLLNSLGYCYYKTGDNRSALEILRSSLRLNPAQESVKKLIREIEKN